MEEKIILKFHPSRLSHVRLYFFGFLFILFSLLGYFKIIEFDISSTYFLFGLIPGIILIFIAEILRLFSTYTITNQRIIEKYGILSEHVDSVPWEKISTLSLKQSFLERLVNIGDIDLWSVGGLEEPEITLINVPNIKKVKDIIDGLIKKEVSLVEEKFEEKKPEEVPEKVVSKIKPKLRAEEVETIVEKYLKRSKISIISILFSKFLSKTGTWRFLLYTNKGYYEVEVSDEGKVVGSIKLTDIEAQQLKQKYLEEKFN